jgi:predicted transcriptional regulator
MKKENVMLENDFVMRTIHDMVRMILKLLFGIDPKSEDYELNDEADVVHQKLMDMIRNGQINEAENWVYELTENGDTDYLEVGVLFYDKLNQLDNKTLSNMDYSREEVAEGLKALLERYGYAGLADSLK